MISGSKTVFNAFKIVTTLKICGYSSVSIVLEWRCRILTKEIVLARYSGQNG